MKTFMTPKENLLAVLKHKEPEWIPCTPHIANLNNIPGQLPAYLLKEPIDRLAISKYLGGDLLYEIGGAKAIHGNTIIIRNIKNEDVIETQYETPSGHLIRKTRDTVIPTPVYSDTLPDFSYPPDMRISTVIEHEIKGVQDYNILEYICKNTKSTFDTNIIDKNMALLADDGLAVLSGPSTPFYKLISNSAGLERIVYDLMDHGGEVESLMNVMADKNYEWYKRAAQTNIEVLRCTEDLDTNLISPTLFKKYSVPVLTKYAQICHDHNKILLLHMCGHIRDLLPLIKETGVDAIHCLCPPKTGNTPLKLAREILGGEIAVMARIDPPVLLSKTPAEISKAVQDMLEEVIPGDNFIVILPCGRAPLNNLKSVIDTVKKYGKYPIPA
jgi:uroporphyrinogen-III decarboxylase